MKGNNNNNPSTQNLAYTNRLVEKQETWWKRLFDVQAPYRILLQLLKL